MGLGIRGWSRVGLGIGVFRHHAAPHRPIGESSCLQSGAELKAEM